MSKRAVITWYVVYGLVAAAAGTVFYWLASLNRFLDAAGVLLMAASAIWVSATNVFYDDSPPGDNGTRMDC